MISAILIIILVAVNAYFFLYFYSPQIYVIFDNGNKLSTQTTTTAETTPQRIIETKCTDNSDCMWETTNCCSENSGASWECVNGKTFVAGCPQNVLCPQFVSPKPNVSCVCNQRSCGTV